MAPRSAVDRIITDDRYRGRGCRRRRRRTKTHIVRFIYIVLDFPYVFFTHFFRFRGL